MTSNGPSVDPASAGKRAAGRAAVVEVRSGMTVGLGTGSTVRFFLEGLAEAIGEGRFERVRGVATSVETAERARTLGIPLVELSDAGGLDLAVDGADEVDPGLELIKGLGGALLREKMIVQAARRFVVIADVGKEVERLGTRAPLPVEVVPFAWEIHLAFFTELGSEPVPRREPDGTLVSTDNGNPVVDLRFPDGIEDPRGLDRVLHGRAGVVETGLFLDVADRVYVGGPDGVATRDRDGDPREDR